MDKKNLIEKRLTELLTLFGLEEKINLLIVSGQRRGVDIVEELSISPGFVLDEPTIGLNVSTRVRIWRFIHKLRKSDGITLFLQLIILKRRVVTMFVL